MVIVFRGLPSATPWRDSLPASPQPRHRGRAAPGGFPRWYAATARTVTECRCRFSLHIFEIPAAQRMPPNRPTSDLRGRPIRARLSPMLCLDSLPRPALRSPPRSKPEAKRLRGANARVAESLRETAINSMCYASLRSVRKKPRRYARGGLSRLDPPASSTTRCSRPARSLPHGATRNFPERRR